MVSEVFKEKQLVKTIEIPMNIEPRYGSDSIDVRIHEEETEKLLK